MKCLKGHEHGQESNIRKCNAEMKTQTEHTPGSIWKDYFISKTPWRYKTRKGVILAFRTKRRALEKLQAAIAKAEGK